MSEAVGGSGRPKVDRVVANIDWLITVDGDRRIIRDAAVAIKDHRFVAVGTTEEVMTQIDAHEVVDGRGTVATPGFIDGHLHSSFQLSRGLADEVNAQAFLYSRMYPYEGALESEDVYDSARLASWELLRHGVTCFVDPGNYHPDETVRACREAGIRVFIAHSSFDQTKSVLGLLPERMIDTTESALAHTEQVLEKYAGPISRGYSASASFRGLNNSSDELIKGLHGLAESYDTFVQCHACFSYSTRDASVTQSGMAEIQRLEHLGVLNERMYLVHTGWLEPNEFRAVVENKPMLIAAPTSSMHSGYGNLHVGFAPEFLEMGVTIALGSDHASSGSVDMLREMFLAGCGFKESRMNPRVMPPETVVEMATIGGARAAGVENELGSVEAGKLADMVMFDANTPEWQPLYNPISNLVYSASGSTVKTVMVGGDTVVHDGALVKVDEDSILAQTRQAMERILPRISAEHAMPLWPIVGASR